MSGEPDLFIATCSREHKENPIRYFRDTVLSGVDPDAYPEVAELGYDEPVPVWGVKESHTSAWEQMEEGDVVLFYTKSGEYTHKGIVDQTYADEGLAREIWAPYDERRLVEDIEEPWTYMFFLRDVNEVNVPAEALHAALDYDMEHPLGFMRPSDAAQESLRSNFGSLSNLLSNYENETGDIREYSGIQEAMDDILPRWNQAEFTNPLGSSVTEEDVHRWKEPLKAVNHRPHSALEIEWCEEILDLFQEHEEQLANLADELSISEFGQLTRAQTLFVVLLRDIQSEFLTEGLLNHVKFRRLVEGYHHTNRETNSYFVLRTGSDEYQDTKEHYEFKSGIPGYKQLLEAENSAELIFLEDSEFYATGRLGDIETLPNHDLDGDKKYRAKILGFHELDSPIPLNFGHEELNTNFNRPPGIFNIEEVDFDAIYDQILGRKSDSEPVSFDVEHPLLEKLSSSTDTQVFKCTGPLDYWYTSLRYGAVSFSEPFRNRWERISDGDIVVLHSQSSSSTDELSQYQSGILGIGIVGNKYSRPVEEHWWLDETDEREFSLIAQFNRLFVPRTVAENDISKPIDELLEEDGTDAVDQVLSRIASGIFPYDRANELREQTEDTRFPPQSAFAELAAGDEGEHQFAKALIAEMADELIEVPAFNLYQSFTGTIPESIFDDLHFPEGLTERLRKQIQSALQSGKHILFTGPPGTGKTVLARRVSLYLASKYPYLYTGSEITTATADWSTFETVGGYMPDPHTEGESLSFTSGSILGRLRDRQTGQPTNESVVIDEINRADIDKAFGQLLTALTGESVQLPYTTEAGKEIRLTSAERLRSAPRPHEYAIPESWTILATMNTRDKTSLYDLSYAFMRRFTQIRIGAPRFESPGDAEDELQQYLKVWSLEDLGSDTRTTLAHVWHAVNSTEAERLLGPAVVQDMAEFVRNYEDPDAATVTEAVVSYLLPQMEGIRNAQPILNDVADIDGIDAGLLEEAARDILQIRQLETNG